MALSSGAVEISAQMLQIFSNFPLEEQETVIQKIFDGGNVGPHIIIEYHGNITPGIFLQWYSRLPGLEYQNYYSTLQNLRNIQPQQQQMPPDDLENWDQDDDEQNNDQDPQHAPVHHISWENRNGWH